MSDESPQWAESALEKLAKIPVFVRPMAKKKIEQAAADAGLSVITAEFMDESKSKLMK